MALGLLVALGWPAWARARPVIPPEREAEVQALLRPHQLGDEVAPGWWLQSIAIDKATVRVVLVGPEGARAELALDHPDYAPPGSRPSPSFALSTPARPPGSDAALDALHAALARNDDGRFWAEHGAVAGDGEPTTRFATGPLAWLTDGLVSLVVLAAIALGLLRRALAPAPRAVAWGLGLVVAVGAVLRLGVTPEATLEPWSYARFMVVARAIYEGPALALVHPGPVHPTDVVSATVLAYAIATPVAVFLMARPLLASDRAGLVAAGLVAVLPLHLRFSHGDVSSIPSVMLCALVLAMAQAAAREPGWRWPAAMLALVAVPLVPTFLLRPLNILYAPLAVAAVLVDRGVHDERPPVARGRRLALVAVLGALTLAVGVPHLLREFGPQVREGLDPATLARALEVLVSVEHNSLVNPRFTPPGILALAAFGAVDLVRRRRLRLAAFLVGWILASLGTHAYVVPKSSLMQARYHLHLVLPLVCLAACGFEAVLTRVRGRACGRGVVLALVAYLAASPAIHAGFIRDVAVNEQHEWVWVHSLRPRIPEGCTIVEYVGQGHGTRFGRVGAYVEAGVPGQRWAVVELPVRAMGTPPEAGAVLRRPPACTYWYEGLPCLADRPPGAALAPECAAVHDAVKLHEVARLELVSRAYDENLGRGVEDGEALVLVLYRVREGEG